jgi:uncharacterized damage-inducible protein DinB
MATHLAAVFDQILDGWDIPKPEATLKVSEDDAYTDFEPIPYTLATNLHHAVLWQRFWLNKLAGGRRKSGMQEWKNDWRVPDRTEFRALRAEFLEGLAQARQIAASDPLEHSLPTDDEAIETLIQIAVHGAYHLGQINLIKRSAKRARTATKPKGQR